MNGLDRPVWNSLINAPVLAEGNDLAMRFRRDVNLFASARDDSDACLAALGKLVLEGDSIFVVQVPVISVPVTGNRAVVELGNADEADMFALAQITDPGPFLARTHTMGRYIGVRAGGRLIAMAGERMRFPGFTEVSGVCTHPDFRGQGLARLLSSLVASEIQRRGEQAFLHAWKNNRVAIELYESLGFNLRTEVQVAELKRFV